MRKLKHGYHTYYLEPQRNGVIISTMNTDPMTGNKLGKLTNHACTERWQFGVNRERAKWTVTSVHGLCKNMEQGRLEDTLNLKTRSRIRRRESKQQEKRRKMRKTIEEVRQGSGGGAEV